ncbi:hypothetical protein BDY24DRAFT_401001 [Mrakia frigida]|uniref:uncharacterized protein n=1 Tax=Mrakia frigida TaxID=29902 RepID=UPI003FCC08E5
MDLRLPFFRTLSFLYPPLASLCLAFFPPFSLHFSLASSLISSPELSSSRTKDFLSSFFPFLLQPSILQPLVSSVPPPSYPCHLFFVPRRAPLFPSLFLFFEMSPPPVSLQSLVFILSWTLRLM